MRARAELPLLNHYQPGRWLKDAVGWCPTDRYRRYIGHSSDIPPSAAGLLRSCAYSSPARNPMPEVKEGSCELMCCVLRSPYPPLARRARLCYPNSASHRADDCGRVGGRVIHAVTTTPAGFPKLPPCLTGCAAAQTPAKMPAFNQPSRASGTPGGHPDGTAGG